MSTRQNDDCIAPPPACACGNPETTRDRYGTDACATCRQVSALLAEEIVSVLNDMARDGRGTMPAPVER